MNIEQKLINPFESSHNALSASNNFKSNIF